MDVSLESAEQTHERLASVIRLAELRVFAERYCFTEFDGERFPGAISSECLAIVRDRSAWSQLMPYSGGPEEPFGVFSFHFAEGLDNSGFVGWLATHLKKRFGTGVFVICGYNGHRGGIFDYWGCPASLADQVFAEVRDLMVEA